METVIRQRPIKGCDSILLPEPLKWLTMKGEEIKDFDPTGWVKFGDNKDFEYYRKTKEDEKRD